jgi:hypothetical protein
MMSDKEILDDDKKWILEKKEDLVTAVSDGLISLDIFYDKMEHYDYMNKLLYCNKEMFDAIRTLGQD